MSEHSQLNAIFSGVRHRHAQSTGIVITSRCIYNNTYLVNPKLVNDNLRICACTTRRNIFPFLFHSNKLMWSLNFPEWTTTKFAIFYIFNPREISHAKCKSGRCYRLLIQWRYSFNKYLCAASVIHGFYLFTARVHFCMFNSVALSIKNGEGVKWLKFINITKWMQWE